MMALDCGDEVNHHFKSKMSSPMLRNPYLILMSAWASKATRRVLDVTGDAKYIKCKSVVAFGSSGGCSRICRVCTHWPDRSEEHTSELQSRFDLVCRL